MAAVTGTIGSAIGSAIGWIGANATTIGTVAQIGKTASDIETNRVATEAQKKQTDMIKKQQKKEAKSIKAAQAQALQKRKSLIDMQRKQTMGSAGDYSINTTSDIGADYGSLMGGGSTLG